jgi:hypothetical protein
MNFENCMSTCKQQLYIYIYILCVYSRSGPFSRVSSWSRFVVLSMLYHCSARERGGQGQGQVSSEKDKERKKTLNVSVFFLSLSFSLFPLKLDNTRARTNLGGRDASQGSTWLLRGAWERVASSCSTLAVPSVLQVTLADLDLQKP